MNTPFEFDYDLWTTNENGNKHYWVRVKSTREVAEISHEVMKCLRASEKSVRRTIAAAKNPDKKHDEVSIKERDKDSDDGHSENSSEPKKPILSLDYIPDGDKLTPAWLTDSVDFIANCTTELLEAEFLKLLTPHQIEIYRACLKGGMSIRKYAKKNNCHHSSVEETVRAIQKKFYFFYFDTPPKS